jgi:adenosylcobyric acid synthase
MGRSRPMNSNGATLCYIGRAANRHADGAIAAEGRIWGTYLHGLFDNDALRHAWLRSLGWQGGGQHFDRQQAYNRLADHVRTHIDMDALRRVIAEGV